MDNNYVRELLAHYGERDYKMTADLSIALGRQFQILCEEITDGEVVSPALYAAYVIVCSDCLEQLIDKLKNNQEFKRGK